MLPSVHNNKKNEKKCSTVKMTYWISERLDSDLLKLNSFYNANTVVLSI